MYLNRRVFVMKCPDYTAHFVFVHKTPFPMVKLFTIDAQRTKRAFEQFAGNAGPDQQDDQSLRCSITDSMDIVVYVGELRISRSDCRMRTLIWTFAVRIWQKGLFHTLHVN